MAKCTELMPLIVVKGEGKSEFRLFYLSVEIVKSILKTAFLNTIYIKNLYPKHRDYGTLFLVLIY